MIEAVLFDLDDTLYAEAAYVRSGFAAVGAELAARGLADADEAAEVFASIHFQETRDRVFNTGLARLGLDDETIEEVVRPLVACYRDHEPTGLAFHDGVAALLRDLRTWAKVGVVTDGWLGVQQRKAAALGLAAHVDAIVFSDELGRERWKPHPAPFDLCRERLGGVPASAGVFVGDNPERDVAGARAAGLRPVLLRRPGAYFAEARSSGEAAVIDDLAQLPALLDRWRTPS